MKYEKRDLIIGILGLIIGYNVGVSKYYQNTQIISNNPQTEEIQNTKNLQSTMIDYIDEGMTLENVKNILGEPFSGGVGVQGSIRIETYSWQTANEFINIAFQNGRVITKSSSKMYQP